MVATIQGFKHMAILQEEYKMMKKLMKFQSMREHKTIEGLIRGRLD